LKVNHFNKNNKHRTTRPVQATVFIAIIIIIIMSSYEKHKFQTPRSIDRVRHSLKKTDEWIPLLFSYQLVGKRVKGKAGHIGATYEAEHYRSTSSFAVEKKETFFIQSYEDNEIVIRYYPDRLDQFWLVYPEDKPKITIELVANGDSSTLVTLTEMQVPFFRCGWKQLCLASLTCGVLFCDNSLMRHSEQHREDCHEELELYLSH
jgi:hypothetical protein